MSKSTSKYLIVAGLFITSAIGILGFIAYNVVAEGEYLTEQINSFQTQQAQEESYFKLKRIAEDSKDERAELESHFLLSEGDSINFLNQIEKLAPRYGVTINTEGLGIVTDEVDESKWIQVSFALAGSRERIQDFIEVLEELPYVSRLTQVEMESLSSSQWQADVTMRVRVLEYDE